MNVERAQIAEEIAFSTHTYRSFAEYCWMFGYGERGKELPEGMTILDAGAGYGDFAEEATKRGVTVIRIDGSYPNSGKKVPIIGQAPPNTHNAVTGFLQALPFQDNKFDEVLDGNCTLWISTGLEDALSEMWRVTKPGGKIKIFSAIPPPAFEQSGYTFPLMGKIADVPGFVKTSPFHRLEIVKQPAINQDTVRTEIQELAALIKTSPLDPNSVRQHRIARLVPGYDISTGSLTSLANITNHK